MFRRVISSHLKTLTTISSTPRPPSRTAASYSSAAIAATVAASSSSFHPSPTTTAVTTVTAAAAVYLLSHHFSNQKAIARASDALKSMYNAEERGERQVMIGPSSKVIIGFLSVMQKHKYIGAFERVDDHRKIVVELHGRLNKCEVISPRFNVGVEEIEGLTAKLLPSGQFGYIVLTTSAGIMDHEEAMRKNVGGEVIGFFY